MKKLAIFCLLLSSPAFASYTPLIGGIGLALGQGTVAIKTGAAGTSYAQGDSVTLTCAGCVITTNPVVTINNVSGGVVTGITVTATGVISSATNPTPIFTQTATSGSGTGLQITGSLGPIAGDFSSASLNTGGGATNGNFFIGFGTPGAGGIGGGENTGVGYQACAGFKGASGANTCLGHNAGGAQGASAATGSFNIFVGDDSGRNITGSSVQANTCFGQSSCRVLNSGGYNTCFGENACGAMTSGIGNTVIGYNAGGTLLTNESNNLLIGTVNIQPDSTTNYLLNIGGMIQGDMTNATATATSQTINLASVANSVNYIKMTPAATGNPSKIAAAGSDTTVGLNIDTKSTGVLSLDATSNGAITTGTGTFTENGALVIGSGGQQASNLVTTRGTTFQSSTNIQPTSDFFHNNILDIASYTGNSTGGDTLALISEMAVNPNGFTVNAPQHIAAIDGDCFLGGDGNAASSLTWCNGVIGTTGNGGPGTLINAVDFRSHTDFNTGGGTITNHYFLYQEQSTAATNEYGAYFTGNVGFGTNTPTYPFDSRGNQASDFAGFGVENQNAGGTASIDYAITSNVGAYNTLRYNSGWEYYIGIGGATAGDVISVVSQNGAASGKKVGIALGNHVLAAYNLEVNGSIAPSYIVSRGTKFTLTGCTATSTLGGASAGSFASGTTGTCTVTITLSGATALTPAPTNGWSCWANDMTTPADVIHQTATGTTTVTLSGTTVSGDIINFGCMGY